MASIYPNRKDGKIVSFKFRWYGGRDQNGRQIVRCTTWTPDKPMKWYKVLIYFYLFAKASYMAVMVFLSWRAAFPILAYV